MILITGGTGFIGSHTVAALGRTGVRLRQLVHRRPAAIDDCTGGLELVQGDLTDPSSLVGLCTGVDTVVHLASEAGNDEQICTLVNVGGTRRLIDAARKAGVRRMIYLSTAAVYGDGGHTGINEDEIPPAPVSPASRTRLSAERAVLAPVRRVPRACPGAAGRRPAAATRTERHRPLLRRIAAVGADRGTAPPASRSGSPGYADWYRAELSGSRSWCSPRWPGSS
jgi:hypothetical protein